MVVVKTLCSDWQKALRMPARENKFKRKQGPGSATSPASDDEGEMFKSFTSQARTTASPLIPPAPTKPTSLQLNKTKLYLP